MAESPALTIAADPVKEAATTASTVRPAHWQQMLAGAVAEVDPQQIAISRRLTQAQRFEQMQSMIDLVEGIAAYQLRQRQPELSEAEALRTIRSRDARV